MPPGPMDSAETIARVDDRFQPAIVVLGIFSLRARLSPPLPNELAKTRVVASPSTSDLSHTEMIDELDCTRKNQTDL